MKVTIVDYGAGNVPSVERALQRLGAESHRTASPDCISKAEALLLPGVGHYAALVRALDEQNMRASLIGAIQRGVPFLGVCLGLQVLFESSEEAPQLRVRVAIKRETPAHGLESAQRKTGFASACRH